MELTSTPATVAMVTGGASGLGAATARRLHADGAAVVIVDLPASRGAELADELNARRPGSAAFAAADVTDEVQTKDALSVAASLGALRILVNCAGIGTPGKVLGKTGVLPLQDFSRVLQVNLIGTFNVIRLGAEMIATQEPLPDQHGSEHRGVIVNTASVAAFDGQIGQAAYAASKGAVAAMTLPIARELARSGIRVMTVAPGIFATPMMSGLPQAAQDSLAVQVPFPSRLGEPEEYAALVAHIVSNDMLNGETIRLDGAIRMQPR
ncbi:3-hydroxyacyl-CoA dehydrogenase [Acaricomes phytoseiuli]|uniref:3-hydroxyacyl-CoA dehydrogenase n=1 Tax=Acaricomes phytoseiuli TaxID=291968 RepID=UPI00036B1F48|nr:3-hydroxyacyl-CoA dehydrogenase [Acaricomes phytoseiuli]MCW1249719.1 3-hydroxyacyl-CoA dehydrogenase [Acaricomes phytoseiuli]